MFPTTVKRGTSEVSFLTTAEANEALPDVPTDVFTKRFVQVDWARKRQWGCCMRTKDGTPSN